MHDHSVRAHDRGSFVGDVPARHSPNNDRAGGWGPGSAGRGSGCGRSVGIEQLSSVSLDAGILLVVVRVSSEQSIDRPRPSVLLIFCAYFAAIPPAAARCWRVDEHRMFWSQLRKRGGQDESTKRVADSKGGSRAASRDGGRNDGGRRSFYGQIWVSGGVAVPGEVHRENPVAAIDKRWCHAPPAVRRAHHAVKQYRNAVALPPLTNVQLHEFTLADVPRRVVPNEGKCHHQVMRNGHRCPDTELSRSRPAEWWSFSTPCGSVVLV